jgi:hypothetical protein
MTKKELSDYFRKLGKLGGKKSRRILTRAQARAMVKAREAKRKN